MKKSTDNKKVGYLYFIKHYTGIYKIGISKNIGNRLRMYNLASPKDITIIFIAKLYEYGKAEREVINYFKILPNTLKNEWSSINDNQAFEVIKIALKYKGAIFFNDLEVSNGVIKLDNVDYGPLPNGININKAVNLCNRFFKTIDFS